MNGVRAYGFGFPCADVADFTVGVVVPALAGDGIGDGFAEFVGRSGSERIESGQASLAARAAGIGHYGVEETVGSVMIAAEFGAGSGTRHGDGCAWREINEIKSVGIWRGKRASGDLFLQHGLDSGISDRFAGLGSNERDGAGAGAMADGFAGNVVLGKLIEQAAGENEIEELVELIE